MTKIHHKLKPTNFLTHLHTTNTHINLHSNTLRYTLLTSMSLGLASLLLMCVSPVVPASTHASDNASVQVNAVMKPVISISAPDAINIELLADGAFRNASGEVVVFSNNNTGYRVLVSTHDTILMH